MRRKRSLRVGRLSLIGLGVLAVAALAVFLLTPTGDTVFRIAEADPLHIDVSGDRAVHWSGETVALKKPDGETVWSVPADSAARQVALRHGRVMLAEAGGLTVWDADGKQKTHAEWPKDPVLVRFGKESVTVVYPQMVLIYDTNGTRTGTYTFSNTVLDAYETHGGWMVLTYAWNEAQVLGKAYRIAGEEEPALVAAAAGDLVLAAEQTENGTAYVTSQGLFLQPDNGERTSLPTNAFLGLGGGESFRLWEGQTLRYLTAEGAEQGEQTLTRTYKHVVFGEGWTAFWQGDALAVVRKGGVFERSEKGLLDVRAEADAIVLYYADRVERKGIGSFR